MTADQIERALNEAFKAVFRRMAAEDKPATPPPATGNRYVRGWVDVGAALAKREKKG